MKKIINLLLMFGLALGLQAQGLNVLVDGVVVDENGNPVANAPIYVYHDFCGIDTFSVHNNTVFSNPNGYFLDTIFTCGQSTVELTTICPDGSVSSLSVPIIPNIENYTVTLTCGSNTGGGTCNTGFQYTSSDSLVTFVSSTSGGTAPYTYQWDFGDGATSTQANPGHFYTQDGIYTVCLTVVDANGVSCNFCDEVLVDLVNQGGSCDTGFQYAVTDSLVSYFPYVSGGVAPYYYQWDFGFNQTSNEETPTFYYPGDGVYTTCLTVYDALGTSCYSCDTIFIGNQADPLVAWASTNDVSDCSGVCDGSITVNAYGGVAPYFYSYSVAGNGSSINGLCEGNYVWNVTDANGNTVSGLETITCDSFPSNECYDWSLIDFGANCPGYDPVCGCDGYTYENACIAENCFGIAIYTPGPCGGNGNNGEGGEPTDSTCTNITAGFQYFGQPLGNDEYGFAFFAEGTANTPLIYDWDFGDGTFGTGEDVAHTYTFTNDSIAAFTVCLTVWDNNGCGATACETIVIDSNTGGFIAGSIFEGDPNLNIPGINQRVGGPGDPLANVHVLLLDPAGNQIADAYTDANGAYSFNGLLFGDYFIQVDVPGINHTPYHIKITPVAQNEETLDFDVNGSSVTTTGLNELSFASQIRMMPNPIANNLTIQLSMEQGMDVQVVVRNVVGQTMMTKTVSLGAGGQQIELDMSDLSGGIYMISLQSQNEIHTQKVLKK